MKINRRDFIKTGGMVMLGSLAVPSFLGSCTGNKVDQATGISFAQNHFGVSENDMKKVLAAALEKGGDYADLFFEHSYRNNIGLQDGAVNRASSNIDFGMGVRVLAGDQTGYAYVENVTLDEMLKAARTAARIATGSAGKAPVALTEEPIPNNYYGVQTPWDELAVNAKTPYLQKLNDQIFALGQTGAQSDGFVGRHDFTHLVLQLRRTDVLRLSSDGDAGGSLYHGGQREDRELICMPALSAWEPNS